MFSTKLGVIEVPLAYEGAIDGDGWPMTFEVLKKAVSGALWPAYGRMQRSKSAEDTDCPTIDELTHGTTSHVVNSITVDEETLTAKANISVIDTEAGMLLLRAHARGKVIFVPAMKRSLVLWSNKPPVIDYIVRDITVDEKTMDVKATVSTIATMSGASLPQPPVIGLPILTVIAVSKLHHCTT